MKEIQEGKPNFEDAKFFPKQKCNWGGMEHEIVGVDFETQILTVVVGMYKGEVKYDVLNSIELTKTETKTSI